MENPIVQVRGLKYSYSGDKEALRGIDLKIYEGEQIAVIGNNGAGKSTFFLNLNGVLMPDEGEIHYRGQKMTRSKEDLTLLRKNIGIVFQEADNQIIATTVMGEVSFGPMNLKLPKEEVRRRVDQALEYMNMKEFSHRAPHYLSGGEKKKVTIADIIAMESEIIIFDEPTASLDPMNSLMLEEVLKKLSKGQKSILISTHDVDFAYRWAQRVIVFCNGEIIADDSPVNIFKNEEILKRSNLRKPTLMEVHDVLTENGVLSEEVKYPKDIEELKKLFETPID